MTRVLQRRFHYAVLEGEYFTPEHSNRSTLAELAAKVLAYTPDASPEPE